MKAGPPCFVGPALNKETGAGLPCSEGMGAGLCESTLGGCKGQDSAERMCEVTRADLRPPEAHGILGN